MAHIDGTESPAQTASEAAPALVFVGDYVQAGNAVVLKFELDVCHLQNRQRRRASMYDDDSRRHDDRGYTFSGRNKALPWRERKWKWSLGTRDGKEETSVHVLIGKSRAPPK